MLIKYTFVYLIFIFFLTLIFSALPKVNEQTANLDQHQKLKFSKKWLGLFMLIPFLVLALKAYWIIGAGNHIQAEVLSPAKISNIGKTFFNDFSRIELKGENYCNKSEVCFHKTSVEGKSLTLLHDFYHHNHPEKSKEIFLRACDFSLQDVQTFRGFYLHHFSVIATPYRLIKDGNLSAGIISQYGLAPVIPLFLMHKIGFNYYGAIGLIIQLVLVGVFLLYLFLKRFDPVLKISIFLIMLLYALCLNQGGTLISPGFSVFRLLPQFILCLCFLHRKQIQTFKFGFIVSVISLLNSIQFNLLMLGIIACSVIVSLGVEIKNKYVIDTKILSMLIAISGVVTIQWMLIFQSSNSFSQNLFASLEEGIVFHTKYAAVFLLFPLVYFISKIRIFVSRKDTGNNSVINCGLLDINETFALIAWGFLALYCINFYGSPQHFAGFVFMATPIAVYLLYRIFQRGIVIGMIAAGVIYFPALYLSYPTMPREIAPVVNALFKETTFGTAFEYRSLSDVNTLAKNYQRFIEKNGANKEDTYFISKDKIYIEEATGRLLLPISYDAFVNSRKVKDSELFDEMQKRGVNHLVLDSPDVVQPFREFLDFAGAAVVSEFEYQKYIEILSNLETLRSNPKLALQSCEFKYCIYRLK